MQTLKDGPWWKDVFRTLNIAHPEGVTEKYDYHIDLSFKKLKSW